VAVPAALTMRRAACSAEQTLFSRTRRAARREHEPHANRACGQARHFRRAVPAECRGIDAADGNEAVPAAAVARRR
jgi:hypothetical protein